MRTGILLCGALLACACAAAAETHTVLIEAEAFQDKGGWVVDQQFMQQMGSPYLMAHGMGEPVEDARTRVKVPAAGQYRVLVRTWDWASPWNVAESPGKFQVLVNGKPLAPTFGAKGAKWDWQEGGTVELSGSAEIALHDLTGFNGRCDAIILTTDAKLSPPNAGEAMAAFRRTLLGLPEEPEDAGQFDLVVVGGGIAGTCAAVSAARLGLNVALVHDRPVLGGNNSSEIRVHLGGDIFKPPYPALGGIVAELGPRQGGNAQPAHVYEDEKKLRVVQGEKTLHLFENVHVLAVEREGSRIAAVVGQHIENGKRLRFAAPLFVDSTGDGTVGFLAGADFRYGRESRAETNEELAPEHADRQTMGTSVMWYSAKIDEPSTFPETPWAIQFYDRNYQKATAGNWNWETGFNVDQIEDFERVRDHGLRAVFGNWSYQKNKAPDKANYANRKLDWVAYIGGKRESRRLLGDVILAQQDIVEGRVFPDASVTTTWTIDLHYPIQSDQFPGEEFRSVAQHVKIKPYAIPYRCLYSRNVDNLFMAGRHISVTHVALGTIRVMRTTGMMGEVVGMAAAISKKHDTTPRGVYEKHLDELKELMQRGVGKALPPRSAAALAPPPWLKDAGPNLARQAKVAVSSRYDANMYAPEAINDGQIDTGNNRGRWVSNTELPHEVELRWTTPQAVSAVRIVSGQSGSGTAQTPITDFAFQYHDGQAWRDVPGAKAEDNEAVDWAARFAPVQTDRLRMTVTRAPGDLARLWELEVYNPPKAE
jgi:hypothetical protein